MSKAERKTAAVAALTISGIFLVFICVLIALVAWLIPTPLEPWAVEFTSNPAGIVIIVLCSYLWLYVPEALKLLLGPGAWSTYLISGGFFLVGLLTLLTGLYKLTKLESPIPIVIAAILLACIGVAGSILHPVSDSQPPSPRSYQHHR